MNDLIVRIKARAADPRRVTDSAIWQCVTAWEAGRPPRKPPAPASEAEVDAAEAALGFRIPPFLLRLYLEVGNGGFGPGAGDGRWASTTPLRSRSWTGPWGELYSPASC
jgi:hypothetical protein